MSGSARLTIVSGLATAAAATSFAAVFQGPGWFLPIMIAVAIVTAVSGQVRRSRVPAALGPVLAALAVLWWLIVLDAHAQARLGVIPGPAALAALREITRSGFDDIDRLTAPVPTHPGTVLLATVSVAAVALVVDLLAVTLRRATLAGVPLLALTITCAAIARHGVNVVGFIIGAAGFLALLAADSRDRILRWGSAAGDGTTADPAHSDAAAARAPAALGRRVGGATIGLGVLVPLLFPGLHPGFYSHHGHGSHSGDGGGSVVTVNPIVSVASDLTDSADRPVLSYRSSAASPPYLRLTSLDSFNGTTFSAPTLVAPASSRVSAILRSTGPTGTSVLTSVAVRPDLAVHWLPAPARLVGVQVSGDWRYDAATSTAFSASSSTAGLTYTTTSVVPSVRPAQLGAAARDTSAATGDLSVPSLPAVQRVSDRVTSNATSPYRKAVAIQRFLTGPQFHYDTSIPADNSPGALTRFLTQTRRGFCQQFATAMAVMAREQGIPARVAVGFTHGHQRDDGSWLVTTHDAHAWPELYFAGFGWLPFEPTPRADGQAIAPAYSQGKSPAGHHGRHNDGSGAGSASEQPAPNRHGETAGGARTSGTTSAGSGHAGGGSDVRALALLALVALLLVLAVAPATVRAAQRRRRWGARGHADAVSAAWLELRDSAVDLGVWWPDERSPREIARLLGRAEVLEPGAEQALVRIVDMEERHRYAPAAPTPGPELRADVSTVARSLRERRSRFARIRARVMPRSTLRWGSDQLAVLATSGALIRWRPWSGRRPATARGS